MLKQRIVIAASVLAVVGLAAGSAYPAATPSNPPPVSNAAPGGMPSGMMGKNSGMAPNMTSGGMMPMVEMMMGMSQMATQGARMMKTCNDIMQRALKSPGKG